MNGLIQTLRDVSDYLFSFLTDITSYIQHSFDYLMNLSVASSIDLVTYFIDVVSSLVLSTISELTLATNFVAAYANIPTETMYMLNVLQVPQAISIVLTAFGVRFILKMIPFV